MVKSGIIVIHELDKNQKIIGILCETLCEKIHPKFAKGWKISQNVEIKNQAFSTCCNKLRRL
jgi:hypothetical protein